MRALRVGLVGFGLGGQAFHAPLVAATDGLELSMVVSSRAEAVYARFPGVAVQPTIEPLLADPAIDLVVISTPDEFHHPQALAALDAGKHVVVDKPFAVTLDQAQAIAQRAQQCGRVLAVFHNRRWDADFLTLREVVTAGKLGEVMQFESHFDRFRPVALDRWKDRRAGGVWQDLGPHLVDQILQLFGMPDAVIAEIAAQKDGAPDYAHVVLRYGRMRAILHISQSAPDHALRFAVHGTGGSYFKSGIDPQESQALAGLGTEMPEWGLDPDQGMLARVVDGEAAPREAVPNRRGDYPAFYRQVRDAIAGQAENPVPPEQALAVMQVIDAGLRSAREGRTIRLDGPA